MIPYNYFYICHQVFFSLSHFGKNSKEKKEKVQAAET